MTAIKYIKNTFPLMVILLIVMSCSKSPQIITDSGTLPEIYLNINEKYLWSADSGLYIIGSNGISNEPCRGIANYFQKWEFPATIEYYENGQAKFFDNVGLRIKGNCTRTLPMKSLGIYWRKEYGRKKLEYPMFSNLPISKFKRLILRNSGNDFGITHIKDAAVSSTYKGYANVDYQEYKPCVVYLNNEYWGIHNIREMLTTHHFKYHYGVDDDEIDLLVGSEITPEADDGNTDTYNREVVQFLQNHDLSNNSNYQEFCDIIDVISYMDYIIINTYIYNKDWPMRNGKWWKDKTSITHTKWRWVVYDTDFGMSRLDRIDAIWLGDYFGTPYKKCDEGFFIFNNLIKNKGFEKEFLERYLFFIEVVFEESRFESIVYELQNNIEQEYPNHQKKWNTLNKDQWNKEIQDMIKFNNKRNKFMKSLILELRNES